MRSSALEWVGGLLAAALLNPVQAQVQRVSAVIDGDRLVLDDGSRIQLAAVDAPERHVSAKMTEDALAAGHDPAKEERLGQIAAAYLAALVRGKPLLVEYVDPAAGVPEAQEGEEEPYRPAFVFVADERGNVQYELNARLVADGYARLHLDDGPQDLSAYIELYREAKRRGLGLWAPERVVAARSSPAPEALDVDDGDVDEAGCTTHAACVWVTADTSGVGPGVWQSRPGKQCPCAGPVE
jgi:endonuclease YncB( thermonuclease family)